jgi:hypothetical protein
VNARERHGRIIFAGAPPAGRTGRLVEYAHRTVTAPGWQALDIRTYSRPHGPQWLDEAERWHRELSAAASSLTRWWWLMPGSRIAVWYPHNLKPLLFAAAVAEAWSAEPDRDLCLIGCPADAREYIREWAEGAGAAVEEVSPQPDAALPIRRASLLRPLVAAAVSARRAPRRAVPRAGTIVFSHSLDLALVRQIGDHFFGRAFDGPAARDVLWFYDTSRRVSAALVRQLDTMGRRALVAASMFRWSDLVFALKEGLAARRALTVLPDRLPVARVGRLASRAFPRRFVAATTLGDAPVESLLLYRAMRRCLDMSGASTLVFPYEEKGLERALLAAAADSGHAVETIAFAHAAYNQGHQYVRSRGEGDPPRASRLAVTGSAAADWFAGQGVSRPRMLVFGSPRTPADSPVRAPAAGAPLRVLFLNGHGSELRLFAAMASDRPDFLDGATLRVRRYPFAWIREQNEALEALRASGVRFDTVEGDLGAQIDDADLVLFASTSAGIEAMIRGRLAARLTLDDIVTVSPAEGKGFGGALPECETAGDVRALVDEVRAMAPAEYARRVEAQRLAARRLYAPVDAGGWSKRGERS